MSIVDPTCRLCRMPLTEPSLGWVGYSKVSGIALPPNDTDPRHVCSSDCDSARMYHRGKKAGYDAARAEWTA